jgi:hypothetical protein
MAYDQAFYYIVLGGCVAVAIGVAFFLWRSNRSAKAGGSDEDGR